MKTETCLECNGSGRCPWCSDETRDRCPHCIGDGVCPTCNGTCVDPFESEGWYVDDAGNAHYSWAIGGGGRNGSGAVRSRAEQPHKSGRGGA